MEAKHARSTTPTSARYPVRNTEHSKARQCQCEEVTHRCEGDRIAPTRQHREWLDRIGVATDHLTGGKVQDVDQVADLLRPGRYPRSSDYDPEWVLALDMGPHPLWQLEDLLIGIEVAAGSQVLDLGPGMGDLGLPGARVLFTREGRPP
jgi:hypothetical protein